MADANEVDPFAAVPGGGVKTKGGGWVPANNPDAIAAQGGAANAPAAGGGAPAVSAGGYADPASVSSTIPAQADAASTYSATPGAAPLQNTANQGAQDVLRNSYLDRATQGTEIDRSDPTFRGQVDGYAASQERVRRNSIDDAAEGNFALGMGSSGNMDAERRLANETASRNTAGFESDLARSELMNKREEIAQALQGLGGMISGDQARMLTKNLADLDAVLKRESMAQTGKLAESDLALRQQLGMGGLNLDALRTQLQNDQFNKSMGFNMADREQFWNNQALQYL